MRGIEVKVNINAVKSKQPSVTGAAFSHLPVCLLVIFTNFLYFQCLVKGRTLSAHVKFGTMAHHRESVSALIVIHKRLSAPGVGPSWQPRTMLRLSSRHYVNWHVQCNSLIRLN